MNPAWLTSTVCDLIRLRLSDLDLDLLPMLGDALMDAGCDDDRLLTMATQKDVRILFLLTREIKC